MSGRAVTFPVRAVLLGALLALAGCTATGPAPVSDRTGTRTPVKTETPRPSQIVPSTNGLHTVQRGETLYAIAFANGLDHRDVALWNQLESADRILVGQVLRLTPPPGAVEVMPLEDDAAPSARPLVEEQVLREPQAVLLPYSEANWAQATAPRPSTVAVAPPPAPAPVPTPLPAPPANAGAVAWMWPAEGPVLGRFGATGGKGIDIAGERNTPVVAIAPGKVVYSGSGLRGYGRLLIVKHADEYLSAYAHNESILVKEGDTVAAGQKIALMGDSDADRVKLHFEIRRYGKPLDPLNFLPERS
ncbi:MAG: peptidoglycan DD-metalloendopeptidase family protein [Gammaproteobacteria bacterium]